MKNKIMRYKHHGFDVHVKEGLKNKHKDYCLCYECGSFKPNTDSNCDLAEEIYEYCKEKGLTLVVWECPLFKNGR